MPSTRADVAFPPKRHVDPSSSREGFARGPPADASAADSWRSLPRSDRSGCGDERVSVGATRRRTCDPGREGGTTGGCV